MNVTTIEYISENAVAKYIGGYFYESEIYSGRAWINLNDIYHYIIDDLDLLEWLANQKLNDDDVDSIAATTREILTKIWDELDFGSEKQYDLQFGIPYYGVKINDGTKTKISKIVPLKEWEY